MFEVSGTRRLSIPISGASPNKRLCGKWLGRRAWRLPMTCSRMPTILRAVGEEYEAIPPAVPGFNCADFVANWALPNQRARLGRMFAHRSMSGAILNFRDKKNPTPTEAALECQYLARHSHRLMSMFGPRQNEIDQIPRAVGAPGLSDRPRAPGTFHPPTVSIMILGKLPWPPQFWT